MSVNLFRGTCRAEAVQLPTMFAEPTPQISLPPRRWCALADGFSLHANTSVDAADRVGLERLARYLLRPMISADRVTLRPVGPSRIRPAERPG